MKANTFDATQNEQNVVEPALGPEPPTATRTSPLDPGAWVRSRADGLGAAHRVLFAGAERVGAGAQLRGCHD